MSRHTIELSAADCDWAAGHPRRRWRSMFLALGVLSVAYLWAGGCQRQHWLVWFDGEELTHAQAKTALEMPHAATDRVISAITALDLEHLGSIEAMSDALTRTDAPGNVARDVLRRQAERCIEWLRDLARRDDEVGDDARANLTSLQKLFP